VIRGVPVLKDIPVLGVLFSSKDFEEKATEIIFVLTPSISSGSGSYSETVQMIREKYKTPDYSASLEDIVTDPIGSKVYTEMMEEQAEEARVNLIRARRDAEDAARLGLEEQKRAEEARVDTQRYQAMMKQSEERIQKARQQLEEAQRKAEAEQSKTEEQKARIQQLEQELVQAREQALQAQQQSEASKKQAQEADSKARALEKQAAEAEKKAQQLRQQTELLRQKKEILDKEIEERKKQEESSEQPEPETDSEQAEKPL